MTDDPKEERLDALDARIKAAKGEEEETRHHSDEHYSQAHLAWRMVIELVAGLLIGFGIGYGLDVVFGSAPWLMVLFIGLGFAAGVRTMMRSAQEIQREAVEKSTDGKKD